MGVKHGGYSMGAHYLLSKSTLNTINFVGHTINEEMKTKKTKNITTCATLFFNPYCITLEVMFLLDGK